MELVTRRLRGAFALKIALALALVTLGDVLFYQQLFQSPALGIFALAILAAVILAVPSILRSGPAKIALGVAAVYALAVIYNTSFLAWFLFGVATILAILLPRSNGFDDGWKWFQRLVYHCLVSSIAPFADLTRWLSARSRRGYRTGFLRQILPTIVLPLLGSLLFILLFSAANPVIEDWFGSVEGPNFDEYTVLRLILWAVFFWYVWAFLRPHMPRAVLTTFEGRGDIHLPGVTPASVLLSLIAFNALFLLQNGMDAAWLWAGVSLPEQFTLAEYAHRGAYPLIATALLAALFVLFAMRPASAMANMPAIRWLVGLWVGQNVFLVFNAALRTLNYINAYSLTELRIAALLWMALVVLGLVLVLYRLLADKSASWLINTNLGALALVLTATCFVDLGAVAAQWNVRHAREVDGDGAGIDLCYLNRLEGSALLSLIELEQRELPAGLKNKVSNIRRDTQFRLMGRVNRQSYQGDILTQWRLQQAEEEVSASNLPLPRAMDINCDGSIFERVSSQSMRNGDEPFLPEGSQIEETADEDIDLRQTDQATGSSTEATDPTAVLTER